MAFEKPRMSTLKLSTPGTASVEEVLGGLSATSEDALEGGARVAIHEFHNRLARGMGTLEGLFGVLGEHVRMRTLEGMVKPVYALRVHRNFAGYYWHFVYRELDTGTWKVTGGMNADTRIVRSDYLPSNIPFVSEDSLIGENCTMPGVFSLYQGSRVRNTYMSNKKFAPSSELMNTTLYRFICTGFIQLKNSVLQNVVSTALVGDGLSIKDSFIGGTGEFTCGYSSALSHSIYTSPCDLLTPAPHYAIGSAMKNTITTDELPRTWVSGFSTRSGGGGALVQYKMRARRARGGQYSLSPYIFIGCLAGGFRKVLAELEKKATGIGEPKPKPQAVWYAGALAGLRNVLPGAREAEKLMKNTKVDLGTWFTHVGSDDEKLGFESTRCDLYTLTHCRISAGNVDVNLDVYKR